MKQVTIYEENLFKAYVLVGKVHKGNAEQISIQEGF